MLDATEKGSTEQPGGPFGRYAERLTRNGYQVVPTEGKAPVVTGWPRYVFAHDDARRYARCNVGLLTRHNPVIDCDCTERELSRELLDLLARECGPDFTRMVRVGQDPKWAVLTRTERPFGKISLTLYRGEQRLVFEVLGDGQQCVSFGTHPSGVEYRWLNDSPLDVRSDDLPTVTEALARRIVDRVCAYLSDRGWLRVAHTSAGRVGPREAAIADGHGLPPMPAIEGAPRDVLRALDRLDPTPREQWIAVGHHLAAIGEDWCEEAWATWSRRSPAYVAGDEERWHTFRPSRSSGTYGLLRLAGCLPDPLEGFTIEAPEDDPPARRALLSWPQDSHPRAIRWTIEGFLEEDSIGVVWGEPASYKSFVTLDWALCVAYGVPWLGQHAISQGDVVIIAGEGLGGINRRIEAWKRAHGVTEPLAGRVGISRGRIVLNDEARRNVRAVIGEVVSSGKRPKVVLIDTVARNMMGNENSQEDMSRLVECIDQLRHALPGTTIVLVHHANKQGGIRGSTVLVGAADFEYSTERQAPLVVALRCNKMKDAEMPRATNLLGQVVDLGGGMSSLAFACGMNVEAAREERTVEELIIEAVRQLCREGRVASRSAIRQALKRDTHAVKAAIDSLVARGELRSVGSKMDGYTVVDKGLESFLD